jgi:Ca2+-binding EF-hand superfamily protein
VETLYKDFTPKGVQFRYVYKALAHPELDGYVQPFSLEERLMHVKEAERRLGSDIPWLCDGMDNATKHTLGGAPNSEFIIDPAGTIVSLRTWSDPEALRSDLEGLVGPVKSPTAVDQLDMPSQGVDEPAARGVVERLNLPAGLQPVRIEPAASDEPYYAKLRAEATRSLIRDGRGQIYLGFHIDPLYHVHWNNLVEPIAYQIDVPDGWVVTPAEGSGPEVEADADMDPREFLVDVIADRVDETFGLTVRYFACSDQWCKPVTQTYTIQLIQDRDAGSTFGRGRGRQAQRGPDGRFRETDIDGDGRLSREEAPDRMLERFDQMDTDGDGFLDESEARRGRPPGRGRGPGGSTDMLARFDTDGDGRISREESPPPIVERFDRIDADGSGFIEPSEMEQMGPPGGRRGGGSPEDRVERFMQSDENGDGKISRDEAPEQMLRIFGRLDADSDGFLSQQEIRDGLSRPRRPGRGRDRI